MVTGFCLYYNRISSIFSHYITAGDALTIVCIVPANFHTGQQYSKTKFELLARICNETLAHNIINL